MNKMNDFSNKGQMQEIYISVDVEANGPIPGPYSLTSIGAYAAGGRLRSGEYVDFSNTPENKFYIELAPISENYIPEAIKVGLLDGFDVNMADEDGSRRFAWTLEHGVEPGAAMRSFSEWVNSMKSLHGARPIFMAYPASFDWTFIYWYLQSYNVSSPFGFSGVLDLKSFYSGRRDVALSRSVKKNMPKQLFPKLPHTHHALDDAVEQGFLGMNLLRYNRNLITPS